MRLHIFILSKNYCLNTKPPPDSHLHLPYAVFPLFFSGYLATVYILCILNRWTTAAGGRRVDGVVLPVGDFSPSPHHQPNWNQQHSYSFIYFHSLYFLYTFTFFPSCYSEHFVQKCSYAIAKLYPASCVNFYFNEWRRKMECESIQIGCYNSEKNMHKTRVRGTITI